MEGLLPFLYRAILHYANGGHTPIGNPFLNESPSASPYYVRLAGGAGAGSATRSSCMDEESMGLVKEALPSLYIQEFDLVLAKLEALGQKQQA